MVDISVIFLKQGLKAVGILEVSRRYGVRCLGVRLGVMVVVALCDVIGRGWASLCRSHK
jgi:hypothetical protein